MLTDTDDALAGARIEVEAQLEQLQLWLPVDRPIIRGRGGLLTAAATLCALLLLIAGTSFMSALGGSAFMSANQILVIIFATISMLAVIVLAARDIIGRLGERVVDRYHPLRSRREQLTITQHMVQTQRAQLSLETIQSVSIEHSSGHAVLIAHTLEGKVVINQHRSRHVLEALGEVIQEQSSRSRQALCAQGEDPDRPAEIPTQLQRLRQSAPILSSHSEPT